MKTFTIRAERPSRWGGIAGSIQLWQELPRYLGAGDTVTVLSVTYKQMTLDEIAGMTCEPVANLTRHDAQQLMDDLWHCGFRPTMGDTGGAMEAMKAHLNDMRHLAFKGNPPK